MVVYTLGYCATYMRLATAARPAPMAKVATMVVLTLTPMSMLASLSSETQRIARPILGLLCEEVERAHDECTDYYSIDGLVVEHDARDGDAAAAEYLAGNLGVGADGRNGLGQVLKQRLMAMAVMSADMVGALLADGR